MARTLQPLIRRSHAFATRAQQRMDGIREISLDFVLMMLTRHGVLYEPRITIIGADLLPNPDAQRATFLASTHTMLGLLFVRHLYDSGVAATIVAADPFKVSGTRRDAAVLMPSRTFLVKVRDLFAAGGTLIAPLDRAEPERRNRRITTTRGDFLISLPLLDLALRQNVRILFFVTTLSDDWTVTVTFMEPPRDADTTVDHLLDEFAAFLGTHLHV